MSLTSALTSAVSGLQVNQKGLEIASHNIGNAHTEGYSRRVLRTETAESGGFGAAGVRVADVQRVTSRFIAEQVVTQAAAFGKAEVRDRFLTNTQDLFGSLTSNSSIGQRLADTMTRMESLALEPESPTAASALIDDAVGLARDLNDISDEVTRLRGQADLELGAAVEQLNTDLELVAELNEQIAAANNSAARDSGDFSDQRDQALKRIGEMINIKTFTRASGEVVVFTGDSRMLVDGDARALEYAPASNHTVSATFSDITLADGTSVQSDIRNGKIKGLLEVRDRVLPNLHSQIDAFAASVRDVANGVHNRGMGLPASPSLSGSRVFADSATDQVTLGDAARFVIADANGLTVATFELAAGTYTIDDLAAQVDAGLGADGSAAVSNGALVLSAANPANGVGLVDLAGGGDMAISFDDGSGAETFAGLSKFFGLNDFFQSGGIVEGDAATGVSTVIEVRSDLISNPERLSRGRLSTDATPPVAGTDHAIAIGDGSMMLALAAAFSEPQAIGAVGGLPPINKPLFEYAGEILGLNAQLKSEAAERLGFEEALAEQFRGRLIDVAGVNIDEELANILVLQNAFNASARVVTTADEMMEIITNLKR